MSGRIISFCLYRSATNALNMGVKLNAAFSQGLYIRQRTSRYIDILHTVLIAHDPLDAGIVQEPLHNLHIVLGMSQSTRSLRRRLAEVYEVGNNLTV